MSLRKFCLSTHAHAVIMSFYLQVFREIILSEMVLSDFQAGCQEPYMAHYSEIKTHSYAFT